MKRIGLLVVALAALLTVAGTVSSQDRKGPRIEIKEEKFDFGKVVEGAQAVHLFEFRNAGDGLLEVQKVQSS